MQNIKLYDQLIIDLTDFLSNVKVNENDTKKIKDTINLVIDYKVKGSEKK